jgi:DNA-binding CsgD family transcriptional regulator
VPLRAAREAFEALGARPWAARAAEELRAAGGRARRPATDPTQLTDREARVAAVAATGATNREIAAELFISVKTVEFHLARVFDKLGVRTRSELAARMARG